LKKAPGFKLTIENLQSDIFGFAKFAFKWVNLRRYTVEEGAPAGENGVGGLYKLKSSWPIALERAWFLNPWKPIT
jgi:hypothetical protein